MNGGSPYRRQRAPSARRVPEYALPDSPASRTGSRLRWPVSPGSLCRSVEFAGDHVHLLLAAQPHEVHRVARYPDCQLGILLRMIHGIEEHVAIEHVHVHVEPGRAEKCIEHPGQIADTVFRNSAKALW